MADSRGSGPRLAGASGACETREAIYRSWIYRSRTYIPECGYSLASRPPSTAKAVPVMNLAASEARKAAAAAMSSG